MKKGVFAAVKKDGSVYYRASITFRCKHISLGSFTSESEAHSAYQSADKLLSATVPITQKIIRKHNSLCSLFQNGSAY